MKEYDVIGIGSPLLDILVEVDDLVLRDLGLKKGEMHLIDEDRSKAIIDKVSKRHRLKGSPGGSAANTIAGVAFLGGKGIFCGAIGDDKYGEAYEYASSQNVKTNLVKLESKTGHAITFITPDSERTFATHLGAALKLRKHHIPAEDIKNSKILHLEAYQFEDPELKEASLYAMKIAKENGVKVSIDLSDPALIRRNLISMREIVDKYADIVFANEEEAREFTGRADVEKALDSIYEMCSVAIVKLGERGSLIKNNDKVYFIEAVKTDVVDTTGAGDMYAAAILYGIANDFKIKEAGTLASEYSSKVVGQFGARLRKEEN